MYTYYHSAYVDVYWKLPILIKRKEKIIRNTELETVTDRTFLECDRIPFPFFFFKFINYESITHLLKTWKIQNVTCVSSIYCNYFLSKLKFLVEISLSSSLGLAEWLEGNEEGYSRPEKHCEQIQHH